MLQHGACQQQNKRASDTAQWLGQSQRHFTCLFVCCEKKVRLSEVKLRNLSLVCLPFFASFIGIAGAARTPSVGRRACTRLVVVSLNFRTLLVCDCCLETGTFSLISYVFGPSLRAESANSEQKMFDRQFHCALCCNHDSVWSLS